LTKEEIEELEEQEDKYQKEKKKRKMKSKDDAIRERTRKRMKGLSTKSTEKIVDQKFSLDPPLPKF